MDMISSADVIRRIEGYLDGGTTPSLEGEEVNLARIAITY
jgi:hypothetical protein